MVNEKPNGGPAFPSGDFDKMQPMDGMTLRDYFAGQALMGVFVGPEFDYEDAIVAKRCYQIADAMLAEREK